MSFKFIENGRIDGAARKRIRSHVMKGKNVGKVRAQGTRIGESEVGNCTLSPSKLGGRSYDINPLARPIAI